MNFWDFQIFSVFGQLWDAPQKILLNRFQLIFWKRLDELCSFLHSFGALDRIKIPYDSNQVCNFCKMVILSPTIV